MAVICGIVFFVFILVIYSLESRAESDQRNNTQDIHEIHFTEVHYDEDVFAEIHHHDSTVDESYIEEMHDAEFGDYDE